MTPRTLTFYTYRQLGSQVSDFRVIGSPPPGVLTGSPQTHTAGPVVVPVQVNLIDNDNLLQDHHGELGQVDKDGGQILTERIVLADGTVLSEANQFIYGLGQGTVTNATTGQTGFFVIVGPNSNPTQSWGLSTTIGIGPGHVVTYGQIDWYAANQAYVDLNNPRVCFTGGTRLDTRHGLVAVEDLRVGDELLTHDGSYQTLRWIWSSEVSGRRIAANEKLAPVLIRANALGPSVPFRDLRVSRQHRMLISSRAAEKLLGTKDVLVAAIKLTEWPGIEVDTTCQGVRYFHLMFDAHQVIRAEGAWSESLLLGPETLKTLSPEALREIELLFPDQLQELVPAFPIPTGKEQKRLVAMHLKQH